MLSEMTINDFLTFVSLFLIPGFIAYQNAYNITPTKAYEENSKFIVCLMYGIINYIVFFKPINYIYSYVSNINNIINEWGLFILHSFTAILLGIIIGICTKNNYIRLLLSKIGIQTEHPTPTSWEFLFSNISRYCWVIVTLKDKTEIKGYYGTSSFASSDLNNKDIYIEQIYTMNEETGMWETEPKKKGIWINGDEIAYIEILE